MTDDSLLGPVTPLWVLEDAVERTLVKWLPTYQRRLERRYPAMHSLGALRAPGSIQHVNDADLLDRAPMPVFYIVAGDPIEPMERDGDGDWTVTQALSVGVVEEARSSLAGQEARRVCQSQLAAVLATLIRHRDLGLTDQDGLVVDCWPIGQQTEPAPLALADSRVVYSGSVAFEVRARVWVTDLAAPFSPVPPGDEDEPYDPTVPPEPWPDPTVPPPDLPEIVDADVVVSHQDDD